MSEEKKEVKRGLHVLFHEAGAATKNLLGKLVTDRFGPIPVRTPGRFGPIPFRSGRFGPISGVSRFGPILVGHFGPPHFIQYFFIGN